ncbi:MAG TPA: hypothetical protein VNT42_05205 [Sphingomonas sp.]|nr:hypothetical protein [Sphingomonas sp.]
MTIDWAGYLHWRPAFVAAIDARLYTPEWLDGRIATGEAWFQRGDDAAIVAELRQYPTGARDVHGLIAAGDVAEIRDRLIPMAEAWGRAQGCIGAIIESRPGWARALAASGYAPHQLALRKDFC